MPQFLTEDMIEIDPYNPLLPTREGDIIPEMPELINPDGSLPLPPDP
jgi:hypothetical protein